MTRTQEKADKRKFERIELAAALSFSKTGLTAPQKARAHNLSTSGISFSSSYPLGIGDIIQLTIPTANTHLPPLVATTKIVRQTNGTESGFPYQLAGEFLEIT